MPSKLLSFWFIQMTKESRAHWVEGSHFHCHLPVLSHVGCREETLQNSDQTSIFLLSEARRCHLCHNRNREQESFPAFNTAKYNHPNDWQQLWVTDNLSFSYFNHLKNGPSASELFIFMALEQAVANTVASAHGAFLFSLSWQWSVHYSHLFLTSVVISHSWCKNAS